MDPQTETLPSIVDIKGEDAPEVEMDHLEAVEGYNAKSVTVNERPTDSSSKGLAATSEESTGHGDARGQDEASRLRSLATDVRDQDDLERDIGRQVGNLISGS